MLYWNSTTGAYMVRSDVVTVDDTEALLSEEQDMTNQRRRFQLTAAFIILPSHYKVFTISQRGTRSSQRFGKFCRGDSMSRQQLHGYRDVSLEGKQLQNGIEH
mgnify:CR=1 FL=1